MKTLTLNTKRNKLQNTFTPGGHIVFDGSEWIEPKPHKRRNWTNIILAAIVVTACLIFAAQAVHYVVTLTEQGRIDWSR